MAKIRTLQSKSYESTTALTKCAVRCLVVMQLSQ